MLLAAAFLLCGCGGAKAEYTAEAGTAEPVVKEVTMAVVGDIMVHDYQYKEAYDPATGTYDFMHNFQDVKRYFEGYDFVIGNLELTFGGPDKEYASFPCFNTPDSFLDAVKDAGFNLLTTANNHSMDTGEAGLKRTIAQLDAYDIDLCFSGGKGHHLYQGSQWHHICLCIGYLRHQWHSCAGRLSGEPY